MKIFLFKVKASQFLTFIRFLDGLDIYIIAAWKVEGDFLSADIFEGYISLNKSNLSEELQLEKLNEKYGNTIKPV